MNDTANHPLMKLKNGSEEPAPLVAVTVLSLKKLFESDDMTDMLALYDLARGAKDRSYDMSFTSKRLRDLGLLDHAGRMHDSIRNIAVSALTVEGDTVKLASPRATS